ncbi:hypothetical protein C8Q80DRAFT_1222076 [Daedaleopsis nitida]|nr:hypothetical protein C8Q80DRAFT_1222076 [Daedaleopsis nitida]
MYWSRRQPLIVTGVLSSLQSRWTPQFFVEQFGGVACRIEDCETRESFPSTVGEFFSLFGRPDRQDGRILRLKDWPPSDRFKVLFPQLQQDFEQAVPLPAYTSPSGEKNFAAHFPENAAPPDLGPKLYSALSSVHDDQHAGSTRLHLDLADAVNILLYASPNLDDRTGCALWHVFAPEDSDQIRKYLQTKLNITENIAAGDPIHNQDTYLTPSMLDELKNQYSVRPYVIYQRMGEAVFVPAGCAHQVSNQADCIKIACDFISPQCLSVCQQLSAEFRMQRIARRWPEDVIPFDWMMYYAWITPEYVKTNISLESVP